MPVYTVHAPVMSDTGVRAADRFAFVRDGFHFWAALLGPIWLLWHGLWLALIGWIVVMVGVGFGIVGARRRRKRDLARRYLAGAADGI